MNYDYTVFKIQVGDDTLTVYYNKLVWGAYKAFSSDEEMYKQLHSGVDTLYNYIIKKDSEHEYSINIASTENFGKFTWDSMRVLLDEMLMIFSPYINRFIAEHHKEK